MGNRIISGVLFMLIFISCNRVNKADKQDNSAEFAAGSTIVADETFAPIISDQAYVFESDYPKEKLNIIYRPEVKLLNMFLGDSVRIAIMSRMLSPEEKKVFENKKIVIRVNRFAVDGIALVSNSSSSDSIITVQEILDIMRGKARKARSLVFDNANSSTVRYLKDLSGVKDLPRIGVYAVRSNPEVIKYVYDNPGTVGVVGMNWIEQPNEENEPYIDKIRVMGVKNLPGKPGSDQFYTPDQTNLALGLYPLTRDLYMINCIGGLVNFASFLGGEKGQRIVLKSGLLPDKIPPREIIIRK